jgi:myosin heavy subunit
MPTHLCKYSTADELLLDGAVNDYRYTRHSNKTIPEVDDAADFKALLESMRSVGFQPKEIFDITRVVAALLHLGNIKPTADREGQAQLTDMTASERACHLLGIPVASFSKALLKPQMKAGRETVTQQRSCEQVVHSVEALARATYERLFGWLIDRINLALDRPSAKNKFIGVLDIAGFEIFQVRITSD